MLEIAAPRAGCRLNAKLTFLPYRGITPSSGVASEINALDPLTGGFEGPIPVDVGAGNTVAGLWSLAFGNAGNNGNPTTLFFTDGINGEANGLFAQITLVPEPSSLVLLAGAFGLFVVRQTRVRR